MSGALSYHLGWKALNLAMLPPIVLVALATLWYRWHAAAKPSIDLAPQSKK